MVPWGRKQQCRQRLTVYISIEAPFNLYITTHREEFYIKCLGSLSLDRSRVIFIDGSLGRGIQRLSSDPSPHSILTESGDLWPIERGFEVVYREGGYACLMTGPQTVGNETPKSCDTVLLWLILALGGN
jgi:hypothetical protein